MAAATMMAVVEPLSDRADRSMQLLTPSDRDGYYYNEGKIVYTVHIGGIYTRFVRPDARMLPGLIIRRSYARMCASTFGLLMSLIMLAKYVKVRIFKS